ncbi:MAG: magnesium transporter CorA family protein, partial [bacterium]|nr:magnesium transporter CorA family protein [bacterium]
LARFPSFWYNALMRNIAQHGGLTWIDIQNPIEEDVEYLKANFALHPVVLEQIIPASWTTKVEQFGPVLFLVMFFPVYSKERRETRSREIDVVVGKNFLLTSHYNSVLPLKAVFDECNLYEEARKRRMGRGAGYLMYHVFHKMWEDVGTKTSRIDKKLTLIEESIFQGREREMLGEISLAKADIINFWRIVRPQKGILTSLRDISSDFFGKETVPYFSHLRNHWARAMSTLIIAKETINSLEQTNNALLTDKTNEIVKLLTIFSVIVFPLTLLAAILGMNTKYLPFVGLPGDFWIIAAIMAAGTVCMIAFFKNKKWL